ncbi:very short patch repair endonuclease [Georgenia yuyongxinii]|uniref:Very short patch repair endonuclease n=1 Tax=Georgenia yuyongxinii TaxID=2589797 RepID=A0A5B8C1U0_9MICO|nr:very short patch repair endonuclease [Georgenia yuyongxinii]QDC24087.1 very short patch repair endonuclease [Georgenia yuyongxinii]
MPAGAAPDAPTPEKRRAMQLQRTKDTGPEVALRRALHRRGLRFRLHRQVVDGLRRTVDIVFPTERVAVDVRGCFWHGCEEHCRRGTRNVSWWESKLAANVARDRDTEYRLRAAGWEVLVVWEHEAPEVAAARVELSVRERREIRPEAAGGGTPQRRE